MRRIFSSVSVTLFTLLLAGCSLFGAVPAANEGAVQGKVLYESKGPVVGGVVSVGHLESVTNEQGEFTINNIPYGTHELQVIVNGFVITQNVHVDRTQISGIDIIVPDEVSTIIFLDDYSHDPLESEPSRWEKQDYVTIRVVEDDETSSGYAMHLKSGPAPSAAIYGASTEKWQVDSDVETVVIDYKMKHVNGSFSAYVNTGTIILHWKVSSGGQLQWDPNKGGQNIGKLTEGWNHIRVKADRTTGQAFIYLNDLDGAGVGPLEIRNDPSSWDGTYLRLAHTAGPDNSGESYFADVQVSIADER